MLFFLGSFFLLMCGLKKTAENDRRGKVFRRSIPRLDRRRIPLFPTFLCFLAALFSRLPSGAHKNKTGIFNCRLQQKLRGMRESRIKTAGGVIMRSEKKRPEPLVPGSCAISGKKGASASGALALGAFALGAFAVGALALGVLAIGRLVVGRLSVRRSKFHHLEVDELSVRRLQVGELKVDKKVEPENKQS